MKSINYARKLLYFVSMMLHEKLLLFKKKDKQVVISMIFRLDLHSIETQLLIIQRNEKDSL